MSDGSASAPATRQLAGKVERLRRELAVLYHSESGWNAAAIDRVANDLAEAECALAGIEPGRVEAVCPHPACATWTSGEASVR